MAIEAPLDVYRDVIPEWIDEEHVTYHREVRTTHDALPRPSQVGRVTGLAARPTTHGGRS